jgi:tRNA (cytidine/uridine-2'-O-)-methyltransferase
LFHIVLVEPEIPANTGNIARTCAVTGTVLHLVKPLGFSVEDKYLKRAGLDYWHLLDIRIHDSLADFLALHGQEKLWLVETPGSKPYDQIAYPEDSYFVFGRETKGLPKALLDQRPGCVVRIPMLDNPKARSLNLSNAVAIVLYEGLRQHGFAGLL